MSMNYGRIESELDELDGQAISSKHHVEIVEYIKFYDKALADNFGRDYLNKVREDFKLKRRR